MRKLASVRKIKEVLPHPNADRLEIAVVDSWRVIVAKGEYQPGDLAIYCEIDSLLPPRPEYDFLERCRKRLPDGTEKYRIRTIRLRGELSQGVLLPLTLLAGSEHYEEGEDVTECLGVTKYEKPVPAQLSGRVVRYFPSFIQKTDEERIQNLDLEFINQHEYYLTEKLDGTSCTVFQFNGETGVCSRNVQLEEDDTNTYWRVAKEQDLIGLVRYYEVQYGRNLALQGEIVGPGIQGNHYGLDKAQFFLFNIFDIDKQAYWEKLDVEEFAVINRLQHVPVLSRSFTFDKDETIDDVLAAAEYTSRLNTQTQREGLVFTSDEPRVSFKAISNKFLLSEGD